MTSTTHRTLAPACAGCLADPGQPCFPGCLSYEEPTTSHRTLAVLLTLTALALAVLLACLVHPYGDASTLNAGFTIGSVGLEVRGTPGLFVCDGQC